MPQHTTASLPSTPGTIDGPAGGSSPPRAPTAEQQPARLPFPPLYKRHVLNCALPAWYQKYRSHLPKTRIIPLPPDFVEYLREDGIFLPRNPNDSVTWSDSDDDSSSGGDDPHDSSGAEDAENISARQSSLAHDPSLRFPETHFLITTTISALGGRVFPKLNWSAPKDATWISPTNSLECRSASDIYLLLKSSDFITHDLEHPFDDSCNLRTTAKLPPTTQKTIPYYLVLRKFFTINPSVEFRVFVKARKIIAITQRDLNYYEFLAPMAGVLVALIQEFYGKVLRETFPDPDFTFDVYIPRTESRVWLIDINPWAKRTDPILFSWLELLRMDVGGVETPELRLVKKDDPEAYSFNTPQYSAHKLPKEVVDAGMGGAQSIQEFAQQWRDIVNSIEDA
ncbi:cell division cycle protein-like protein [Tirmania nivea]|nr:cell division cycle protein-like protein [Tirmania nivea]